VYTHYKAYTEYKFMFNVYRGKYDFIVKQLIYTIVLRNYYRRHA